MGIGARRLRRRGAFTLIELLVVVAIIALLISILLPALKSARKEARRVRCAANQRNLLVACRAYADQFRGYWPLPNWGWPASDPTLPTGWAFDAKKLTYSGSDPQWKPEDVKDGAIYPFGGDLGIYKCPEHERVSGNKKDTRLLTSYLMNGSISAFTATRSFDLSRYRVDAVIYWEPPDPEGMDEQATGWYTEDWQDCSSSPDQGFTFRHGGSGVTLGAIDGHTEWWTLAKYRQIASDPVANALWFNPEAADGRW